MTYTIIKTLISALLITVVTETSKKHPLIGAVFASIPLVSVLAMIWLYIDTKDVLQIALLSKDIFWLVLPSLVLFICLPILIQYNLNFYLALLIAITCMIIAYGATLFLLQQFR